MCEVYIIKDMDKVCVNCRGVIKDGIEHKIEITHVTDTWLRFCSIECLEKYWLKMIAFN